MKPCIGPRMTPPELPPCAPCALCAQAKLILGDVGSKVLPRPAPRAEPRSRGARRACAPSSPRVGAWGSGRGGSLTPSLSACFVFCSQVTLLLERDLEGRQVKFPVTLTRGKPRA
jgi:hypothetical protein